MTQITKENKSIGNTEVSVFLWFIYPKEANKEIMAPPVSLALNKTKNIDSQRCMLVLYLPQV